MSESYADSRPRKLESRENQLKFENVGLWESGRRSNLSRSRSMDFLPQRASTGTKALRALFESKATLQQGYSSSSWLNAVAATGCKTGRDCPLQDWRSHNTPLKDTTNQVCEFIIISLLFYSMTHLPDFTTLTVLSGAFHGPLNHRVENTMQPNEANHLHIISTSLHNIMLIWVLSSIK